MLFFFWPRRIFNRYLFNFNFFFSNLSSLTERFSFRRRRRGILFGKVNAGTRCNDLTRHFLVYNNVTIIILYYHTHKTRVLHGEFIRTPYSTLLHKTIAREGMACDNMIPLYHIISYIIHRLRGAPRVNYVQRNTADIIFPPVVRAVLSAQQKAHLQRNNVQSYCTWKTYTAWTVYTVYVYHV